MRLLTIILIGITTPLLGYSQKNCAPIFERAQYDALESQISKITYFKKSIIDPAKGDYTALDATFDSEELLWAQNHDKDLFQLVSAFNNLSNLERAMVRVYSQSTELSWGLNRALWTGGIHVKDDLKAFLLASALRSLPKTIGILYSGVRIIDVGMTPEDYVKNNFVNGIFEAKGFLSTSADVRINYVKNRPIVLVIRGKTGVNIAPFSNYPFEKEILFSPGSRFKMISVESISLLDFGQKTVITMEEI